MRQFPTSRASPGSRRGCLPLERQNQPNIVVVGKNAKETYRGDARRGQLPHEARRLLGERHCRCTCAPLRWVGLTNLQAESGTATEIVARRTPQTNVLGSVHEGDLLQAETNKAPGQLGRGSGGYHRPRRSTGRMRHRIVVSLMSGLRITTLACAARRSDERLECHSLPENRNPCSQLCRTEQSRRSPWVTRWEAPNGRIRAEYSGGPEKC